MATNVHNDANPRQQAAAATVTPPPTTVTARAPPRRTEADNSANRLNELEVGRIKRQNEGLPGAEVSDFWGPDGAYVRGDYAHGGRVKGARMNRSGRMR